MISYHSITHVSIAACLALVAVGIASDADAIPYCKDVECIEPCGQPGHGNSTATLEWTDCVEGIRQVRCVWDPCDCVSAWHDCHCEGGGGCFMAGTPISMADGKTKSIESVRLGDTVLSYDEDSGRFTEATVTAVYPPVIVSSYYIVNGSILVTGSQPMYSGGRWITMDTLQVGSVVNALHGKTVPIWSILRVDEPASVYNIAVGGYGTYIAHGLIVHNKDLPYTICPQ